MATLQVRLQDAMTRIATECKSIRTLVNGNNANLSTLLTTNKTNLVSAINEVKGLADSLAAAGGATINDEAAISTTQTWSITKIGAEIDAAKTAVRNQILNGAGAAYDTLAEIQAILENETTGVTALTTALAKRVRVDTAAQGLTTTEQGNARTNIGAQAAADIGNPDTNLVTTFESGLT